MSNERCATCTKLRHAMQSVARSNPVQLVSDEVQCLACDRSWPDGRPHQHRDWCPWLMYLEAFALPCPHLDKPHPSADSPGGPPSLDCDHCGSEAALSDVGFVDSKLDCVSCGIAGHVSVDKDGAAFFVDGERCKDDDCVECRDAEIASLRERLAGATEQNQRWQDEFCKLVEIRDRFVAELDAALGASFWLNIAVAGFATYCEAELKKYRDPIFQQLAKHLPPAWKEDAENRVKAAESERDAALAKLAEVLESSDEDAARGMTREQALEVHHMLVEKVLLNTASVAERVKLSLTHLRMDAITTKLAAVKEFVRASDLLRFIEDDKNQDAIDILSAVEKKLRAALHPVTEEE